MTKGIYPRRIERNVPPHPAPHDAHQARHKFVEDRPGQWPCCEYPESHPIHLNRRRKLS